LLAATPLPRPSDARAASATTASPAPPRGERPESIVATFSIVGLDSASGDLGVAVASRFLAVGHVVPWARAGVGAIATQALANTTYGPRGLALLEQGKSAREVLDLLLASDPDRERRQVGIVDAKGRVATFTGSGCQSWAGGVEGTRYVAQGNILTGDEVVKALARGFEETEGSLADRLMAALRAGEAAGGDARGKQSAAILVVRARGGYNEMNDRYLDLRVDDHADPVAELTRIYGVWRTQNIMRDAFQHYQKQEWAQGIALVEEALAASPDDAGIRYNLACFYARGGRSEDALRELGATIAREPSYKKMATTDEDFASLRDLPAWKALVGESAR
jgi:uncharacterized Ntn-hydrolase superfamily protein